MGNLTVKEKEHWKERIGRKVDQAIEQLVTQTDPSYRERISQQAAVAARESLGIAELEKRLKVVTDERKRLEKERTQLMNQMAEKLTPCKQGEYSEWQCEQVIRTAISRRCAVHEKELMAEHPLGKQLLKLDQEKEEMLDTVWLATSGAQIKELWRHVADMLQQPPTALQEEALKLEPSEDE